MCWQITCHFLQQTITSPVHVSLCFPWFNLSPPTHSLILLFPDSLAGLSHFLASVRALAITLVRPFCVPHFGFCSPCSFSFTFPHPPALFNSVIMTYSLGTWPSPSPTLHSRPSFRLPSIPPRANSAGRKLCHGQTPAPTLTVSPASCLSAEAGAGLKMEATEKDPRPLLSFCWDV